jgi:hypothetical protein
LRFSSDLANIMKTVETYRIGLLSERRWDKTVNFFWFPSLVNSKRVSHFNKLLHLYDTTSILAMVFTIHCCDLLT